MCSASSAEPLLFVLRYHLNSSLETHIFWMKASTMLSGITKPSKSVYSPSFFFNSDIKTHQNTKRFFFVL